MSKVKPILRRLVTFVGIVALVLFLYGAYVYFTSSSLATSIYGFRDAGTGAKAWHDLNGNGAWDAGEPPFPGVCVWSGYRLESPDGEGTPSWCTGSPFSATDGSGSWYQFYAGGDCGMLYIYAVAPAGYVATTDLAVNGCSADFGFAQEGGNVSHKGRTIEAFVRRTLAAIWIKRVLIGAALVAAGVLATVWLERP